MDRQTDPYVNPLYAYLGFLGVPLSGDTAAEMRGGLLCPAVSPCMCASARTWSMCARLWGGGVYAAAQDSIGYTMRV